jgi:hypothetical protein
MTGDKPENEEKVWRVLDLGCCAGGGAAGYERAGFNEIVGVDKVYKKQYPYFFIKADLEEWLYETPVEWFEQFDLIHASPPCQFDSITRNLAIAQGNLPSDIDLMPIVRQFLMSLDVPFVIENVRRAWKKRFTEEEMNNLPFLCGSSFGLGVQRHRYFEASFPISKIPCDHDTESWPMGPNGRRKPIGVYGSLGDQLQGKDKKNLDRGNIIGGKVAATVEEAQKAMGIYHITEWTNLKEAIPPAYTEHVGKCFFKYMKQQAEAEAEAEAELVLND